MTPILKAITLLAIGAFGGFIASTYVVAPELARAHIEDEMLPNIQKQTETAIEQRLLLHQSYDLAQYLVILQTHSEEQICQVFRNAEKLYLSIKHQLEQSPELRTIDPTILNVLEGYQSTDGPKECLAAA